MEIITFQKQQIKAAFIVSFLVILLAMVLILQVLAQMVPDAAHKAEEEGDFIIIKAVDASPSSPSSSSSSSSSSNPASDRVVAAADLRRDNPNYDAISSRHTFSSSFCNIWAPDHQSVSQDDLLVNISLDQRSGCGFKSNEAYLYGYFGVMMKFPTNNNTAGVAVTFYTSNSDQYPDNHDEIDFEFLGAVAGQPILVQTNIYGNGSTSTGREQRYHLWFDPSADFHHYSILWTPNHTIFAIDGIAVRELRNSEELGAQYPSKPMWVYATIWDASAWATEGGKYKIDFAEAPFVASYTDFVLHGCTSSSSDPPTSTTTQEESDASNSFPPRTQQHAQFFANSGGFTTPCSLLRDPFLDSEKSVEKGLQWIKQNYMVYDYCQDSRRYPQLPPECNIQN